MINNNDLIVIKGGCGLGKSHIYSDRIATGKALDEYVICLPTNKAKRHIYNDEFCTKTSIHLPLVTPDLDEFKDEEIKHLLEIGAFGQVKEYAKNYISKHSNNKVMQKNVKIMEQYLSVNEKVKYYPFDILTTHSRSFYLTDTVVNSHNFLYDEDIINEAIKIIKVPLKNIKDTLPNLDKSKKIIEDKINRAIEAEYKKIVPVKLHFWNQNEIEAEIKDSKGIYCNINNLLRCSAIARDNPSLSHTLKNRNGHQDDDIVYLLVENDLPKRKTIVLSATADKQLYTDYFGKKLGRNLIWQEAPNVQNAGSIIQHYSYTYSRDCLNRHSEILENIRRDYWDSLLILPKEFIDKDREKLGLELELGNLSGLDDLNGKSLVIVGLPNRGEIYHKMFEYAIYGTLHNEANITYSWEENDFGKFKFATYPQEYKNLRKIRDWECYETLTQTIGRARLTIPENYNSTVEVFAKYPLKGAIYVP